MWEPLILSGKLILDPLDENNELELNDRTWTIYTEDVVSMPQYIGPNAEINHAYLTQGCLVDGAVTNSVLFTDVEVDTVAHRHRQCAHAGRKG